MQTAPNHRLISLDMMRGVIILVMALDHASGLIARGKRAPEMWATLFPVYGSDAAAFLVRAVTHIAAPGFFFLMGAGMALFEDARAREGWSDRKIAVHFVLRGGILIALQFLVENPAWNLGAGPTDTVYVGVLYALGAGMIAGTLLLRVPQRWLILFSAALVITTDFFLPAPQAGFSGLGPVRMLLQTPGYAQLGNGGIWVLYPVLPWLGVVGLGIAFGRQLRHGRMEAIRAALPLGLLMFATFIVLRWGDAYGNIRPRQQGWIGFFNLVKYPPSLTFLLATMGLNLVLLALLQRAERLRKALQPLAVFGTVPLFFYISHLYLYALLGLWLAPDGMPLATMIPVWLFGLLLLYPLCSLYGRLKHRYPLLRYL